MNGQCQKDKVANDLFNVGSVRGNDLQAWNSKKNSFDNSDCLFDHYACTRKSLYVTVQRIGM